MALAFLQDVQNAALDGGAIVPQIATATVTSTVLDMLAADGYNLEMALVTGAITGTVTTLNVFVQECSTTNGTFTNIASSGATAQAYTSSGAGSNLVVLQNVFNRQQRYVQITASIAGTTPSVPIAAFLFAQRKLLPSTKNGAQTT